MSQYVSPTYRRDPSFVALVVSICCLSSRYARDARLSNTTIGADLVSLAKSALDEGSSGRADLFLVQALHNMAVVQEGTGRPNLLWRPLVQALSSVIIPLATASIR